MAGCCKSPSVLRTSELDSVKSYVREIETTCSPNSQKTPGGKPERRGDAAVARRLPRHLQPASLFPAERGCVGGGPLVRAVRARPVGYLRQLFVRVK